MGRALLLALVLAGFASAACADDGLGGLPTGKAASRPKMLSMSPADVYGSKVVPAGSLTGTAVAPGADPLVDVLHMQAPEHSDTHAGCDRNSSDLCYDANDRHIVYRPARALMPTFKGLTAENISANRHGIRLKYSFP